MLLLGIFTQIAFGFVHLEKPRAMLAAVSLFSVAAVVALGPIAAQESPFNPPIEGFQRATGQSVGEPAGGTVIRSRRSA